MGQEVAVTPIQLVTMASTIANGGMYLPPHILLASTDAVKGDPRLKPAVFRPGGEGGDELPNPLPEGAHRVISTLTAAQMRKMMEGVVLFGTGKSTTQLNGYSAGGKTGTAEKIDPRTHTYSKTKFVASFVGFAPVNTPAVTIAVIMDSPDHSMHFGAEASGPVFHELAQEILEYLGVPHDVEVKSAPAMAKAMATKAPQEHAAEHDENVEELFAEVNNLPADDPLRAPVVAGGDSRGTASGLKSATVVPVAAVLNAAQAPALAAQVSEASKLPAVMKAAASQPVVTRKGSVVVDSTTRVAVPSFLGEPMRRVIEVAGTSGLAVNAVGNGLAREQAPAAGTMVPIGTKVVVKFTR